MTLCKWLKGVLLHCVSCEQVVSVLQVAGRKTPDKIYNVKYVAQRTKVIDPGNPDLSKLDVQGKLHIQFE